MCFCLFGVFFKLCCCFSRGFLTHSGTIRSEFQNFSPGCFGPCGMLGIRELHKSRGKRGTMKVSPPPFSLLVQPHLRCSLDFCASQPSTPNSPSALHIPAFFPRFRSSWEGPGLPLSSLAQNAERRWHHPNPPGFPPGHPSLLLFSGGLNTLPATKRWNFTPAS